MTLTTDDTYISGPECFYVTYKRPVYNPKADLQKGTRRLRPKSWETSKTPFTQFDHTKGTTHRWSYEFRGRPKFLQYYWLETGLAIRPLRESMVRMLHPEEEVKNVREYEVLVISHLYDNYHNAHMRNWAFHLLYDIGFMKRARMKSADLFFKRSDRGKGYYEHNKGPPSRMWYRRVDYLVDLDSCVGMQHFVHSWKVLLAQMDEIISSEHECEPYQVRHLIKNELSMRRISTTRARAWFEAGIITRSEYAQFLAAEGTSKQFESKKSPFNLFGLDEVGFNYLFSLLGISNDKVHYSTDYDRGPSRLKQVLATSIDLNGFASVVNFASKWLQSSDSPNLYRTGEPP